MLDYRFNTIAWLCSLIRILYLFVATILYSFPVCINAAEVFIGASVNWTNLDGKNINPQSSDKKLNLALSAKSLDRYLEETSVGYFFELGLDTYDVERLDEWGLVTKQKIFTSTSGEYWYFTPTIFYDFTKNRSSNWSFKVGFGAGISYFSIDGTMVVNRLSGASIETIKGSDFSYSTGVIFKYEYKNLVIQAKEFTPKGKIDGLDLELQLPVITVGYKFAL